MNNRHAFKLLSKTTLIYLVFTFFAFSASAVLLMRNTDRFIDKEIEGYFRYYEHRVQKLLRMDRQLQDIERHAFVVSIEATEPAEFVPVYRDTLILNAETEARQPYRIKTLVIREEDQAYLVSLRRNSEDFEKLKEMIFGALIQVFIGLALVIVLFNTLLSGHFFQPFNRILQQMKSYKVGTAASPQPVRTNTVEFIRMQQLFTRMVERIEGDYRNLKEYTEHMAHELQTPLTVMRSKMESLIADTQVMRRHHSAVKILSDEITHLSKLGTTLNLLTKIENQEFNRSERIVTQPVIERHVEAIHELVALKSLTIEADLDKDHTLVIDPFLLDIVLKNLLRNAISYGTPNGPIRIVTFADTLEVSNYGAPLSFPAEKLFERFSHHNGLRASLGLGLSLVKKVCEVSGIEIGYVYRDGQHVFSLSSV
ncbi:HAMP domain-containing histidine kinase [candidate division KSB1 bacterium]|nr:HAMP domain-containing histidine kinase [candidate division KSB1 bacterium]